MAGTDTRDKLKRIIIAHGNAAVAFSGGVDSTLLAKVCHDLLGNRSIAITIVSPLFPKNELVSAKKLASRIGIRHEIIEEKGIDETVAENTPDRCYHCKKIEFSSIIERAAELGFTAVFDGSNVDDLKDYRPGKRALDELNISSPLREAGMTKDDIRAYSKELGLETWDNPALACLASRIPYGERITEESLSRIDKAEDFLRSLGLRQFRVRSHGDIARIEVSPEERVRFFDTDTMDRTAAAMKSFGFAYAALDLEGYRTGSLNRKLVKSGR